MKIVCISDTHGDHELVNLPQGDVLVHAGDITAHGTEEDANRFVEWFASQPFQHKLFIAGNHDTFLEQQPVKFAKLCAAKSLLYLNDSGVTINGVRFWGSPITPRFFDWSFMRDPGSDIEEHWVKIPLDTQVLITHGPVWGILDEVERSETLKEHTGCPSLRDRVAAIQPDYHVFGHIHEGYGEVKQNGTAFLNVSTMDNGYVINNRPVVIDW